MSLNGYHSASSLDHIDKRRDTHILHILRHSKPSDTDDTRLLRTLKEKIGLSHIIGESPAFLAELQKIPRIARTNAKVLISGDTGTGKEVFARAIHHLSPRTGKPFVPVNCGAIPVDIIENELFGHARGAFTSATSDQAGVIQEAEGGTLFLDEIDSLPLLAQVKLLRFLQEHQYRPLGAAKSRHADVRVIAATNIDLEAAIETGHFRRDLYYRLNTIPLHLPPLRERPEDIPLLARHFAEKYAAEFEREVSGISVDALQLLLNYEWPGNIRELENTIERAVVLAEQATLKATDLGLPQAKTSAVQDSFQEAKAKVIDRFEQSYIERLLLLHQGNITKAAQAARKNRRAFWQLMHKHGIQTENFKPKTG